MWRAIRNEIKNKNERFVLGVSGGMDSMFMLDFFRRIPGIEFVVGHFNHQDHEIVDKMEVFVREYCRSNGIAYWGGVGTHENKGRGFEDEDRRQRYAFLNHVKTKMGYDRIVTAHHFSDQIETIFLRLIRGYPHDNLKMKSGEIYRPFLNVEKAEIEKQVSLKGIPYIDDPTNSRSDYDRNFLRNEILPLISTRRNVIKSMKNGI